MQTRHAFLLMTILASLTACGGGDDAGQTGGSSGAGGGAGSSGATGGAGGGDDAGDSTGGSGGAGTGGGTEGDGEAAGSGGGATDDAGGSTEGGADLEAGTWEAGTGPCEGKSCGDMCNSCPPSAPLCPGAVGYCDMDGKCMVGVNTPVCK